MRTIFAVADGNEPHVPAAALEEAIANEGFRGRWYALTAAHNVTAHPLAIERLGERLVAWRDAAGTAHVQEDRCPHRGARLSGGRVAGDNLICPYHGIHLDGDGRIVTVPALPGCPLEGRIALRTYATTECGGVLFAFFPGPSASAPVPFVPPFELVDPAWSSFVCEALWNTNWRYAVENVLDPMHGPYLHGDTHAMQYGSKEDVMEITATAGGFRISRKLQQDVAFDWTECSDDGLFFMRLDIPYPPKVGPGGPFRVIGFATPIDERSTAIFFLRLRHAEDWQRDLWRFLYRDRLEARHWYVLEQDRVCLERMADDAREHEMLYQHDIGVTRLRRRFKELARAEIAAARQRPRTAQRA